MTSPVATFMNTMRTTWEAVSPTSDGSAINYRVIDDFVEERGNGLHRQIVFSYPRAGDITSETPVELEWQIDADLILLRRDRTQYEFAQHIAHGISDLVKAYSNVSNWGSGAILEVIMETPETSFAEQNIQATSGGIKTGLVARIRFPFRVLCVENA